jgi:predicted PurR-regulated permease PerM
MTIALQVREASFWLLGTLALMVLLYYGQPLLVPVAFAILIWALMNALADLLVRAKLPRWGAWAASLTLISLAMYLVILIVGNETGGLAQNAPLYVSKVEQLTATLLTPMHLGFSVTDLFSRSDVAGFVASAAASLGTSLFAGIQVIVYVGFLLAEQKHLAAKFGQLITDEVR